MINMLTNNRNQGIDILKFLAVLLILNSHMESVYGKYHVLATGGALGDALFFFCSGFTLSLKPIGTFWGWYKKRINRIYSTVFAVAIISCLFWGNKNDIITIIVEGGGWFVQCIMLYYIIIFIINKYFNEKINWILVLTSIACFAWYFLMNGNVSGGVYGWGYFRWLIYFNFMLLGAKIGTNTKHVERKWWINLLLAGGGIMVFYTLYLLSIFNKYLGFLDVFSYIPLLIAVYYLYHMADNIVISDEMAYKGLYFLIRFVGGLCLEAYLIQGYLITDAFNTLFPLNLIMVFSIIIFGAYFVRCLARFISQLFKESPFDVKKIFEFV